MSSIQGTLAQWRDRLRRKELSPAELVNLTADAIEADRTTNAYISFDREAALKAACAALGKLRERYNAQKKAMDAAKRPAGTQTE